METITARIDAVTRIPKSHLSEVIPAPKSVKIELTNPKAEGIRYERGGTAVCMEGPQFSTLAESLTYRQLGYDIVHMTSMPEAKLAREAEIPYACVAMVTDYDCWHEVHGAVDVASLVAVMHENRDRAQRLFARLASEFPAERIPCPAGSHRALDGAVITHPEARDPALVAKLRTVAGRVLRDG